jgi:hypothetical protein
VTYENHLQIWEDFSALKMGRIVQIEYRAASRRIKFTMGNGQLTLQSPDVALITFDEEAIDTLIHAVETIMHGRRVNAGHFDLQLRSGNAAYTDYCVTISFDSELYSFDLENMNREHEFTPYAQPWDKIVK